MSDQVKQEQEPKPRRGRPPVPGAKSGADRQREYRERKKAEGIEEVTVLLPADVRAALAGYVERYNKDKASDPITVGQAVERIVRDRLMRKR